MTRKALIVFLSLLLLLPASGLGAGWQVDETEAPEIARDITRECVITPASKKKEFINFVFT